MGELTVDQGRAGGAGVDPALADRVIEALLLAGLPVAYGGHGPGVRLVPGGDDDGDGGAMALRWVCSARLEDAAAAGSDGPWHRARRLVVDSVETALAEFLPALGVPAERLPDLGVTRVGPLPAAEPLPVPGPLSAAEPLPHPEPLSAAEPPVLARAAAGSLPGPAGVDPELTATVRRIAALAGLPVADRPGSAGVVLGPHAADDEGDGVVPGTADLDWRPSRQLPGGDEPDGARVAVTGAMRHALGAALNAGGLPTAWHRPRHRPAHLHAVPPPR
ncbi:hypothetical protein ACIQBJ_16070 [Kitasatospora sp. NPDC088391]|uniref:hypothetical protein n=1 Tax=Kitasatospora sp. NPDC088391 TaxID=3364074 RepID=UPI00380B8665